MSNKMRFGALVTALFLILLVTAVPVLAQEATAEPTPAATQVSEVDPVGVVIPPATEQIMFTWQGLTALISIVLTVGIGGGVGGALVIIRQARQSEELKYAMERLYLSAPPGTQENIRQIVQLLVEGAALADEVTDGVLEAAWETRG